jgi:serpin B
MKRMMLLAACCAVSLAFSPLGAKGVEGPVAPADTSALATPTSNAFAANLYAKLAAEKGNLFFSPFSIDVALAMTSAGARGKTYDEMAKVLDFPLMTETEHDPYRTRLHQNLGAFLKDLNAEKGADGKPRGYQLSVANALWGQKGEPFLPEFLKVLKDNYGAGLSDVDFRSDVEGARKTINTWVEKETKDKIKDLLKPGILDPRLTVLVLTNAIYFKGNWADQFKKEDTKDEPFHLAADQEVKAPLMHRTGQYGYFEEEMIQGLKLPYAGNELSMVILMPKKVSWTFEGKTTDALSDLEKELTAAKLEAWTKKLRTQKVIVTIPKFKTTAEFELSATLSAMGMKEAFTMAADFSGMNGKKDLFISAVVHKAFVDVNEEGTEAAAATAVIMGRGAAVAAPPPAVFKADHPFLFLIRHEKSGAILFMGRIVDPTK